MTFLAPAWLGWAAFSSLVVAAIHLIAWRIPRTVLLPTARFVPDLPSRYAARTVRMSDLVLLAVRMMILILGGAALARPVGSRTPAGTAAVVVVERSAAMPDTAVIRSRLAEPSAGGSRRVFVVFDTVPRVVPDEAAALGAIAAPDAPAVASLSAGLLAAARQANRLARDYDTVRVVLASTFARAAFDAATSRIRELWPDSIRFLPLVPVPAVPSPVDMTVVASGDDPVGAAIALTRSNGLLTGGRVRVVRHRATAADTGLADSGVTVVLWPRAAAGTAERVDGVVAGAFTAIGYFIPLPSSDSGRVTARWVNGAPAATQVTRGRGCIRTIHFDIADAGDFALTPAFQRVAAELVAPCNGHRAASVVSDSALQSLSIAGDTAVRRVLPDEVHAPNRIAAALIVLAIALAALESLVRRRAVTAAPAPEAA